MSVTSGQLFLILPSCQKVGGRHTPRWYLVIHKLFAGRARDLEEVASVIRRQRTEVDWAYLEKWAKEFASVPGRERMSEQIERLRREHGETD